MDIAAKSAGDAEIYEPDAVHSIGERRLPGDTERTLFLIRVFRVLRGNLQRRF